MTREEIEELKGLAASMGLYDDKNPCKRAVILGKAIKELEQEPCDDLINQKAATCRHSGHCEWIACDKCNQYEPSQQPCEDCISRQAIKRKLQEHHDFFIHAYGGFSNLSQNDKSRVDEITNCIAMVVNEPSVTPKEKTGHWIFDEILDRHYYCSECKSMGVDYWDYCPECGARMVEPQESKKVNCKSTKCENCINHNYCDFEPQESEGKE